MTMYFCNNCGSIVKGIERNEKIEGFLRPYIACEYCKSDDLIEAGECHICGKNYEPNGKDICEECETYIFTLFWQMMNTIRDYDDSIDPGEVVEAMATVFDDFYNKYRFKK